MWPSRGACPHVQHGRRTFRRQTLERKPVFDRPFVMVRELLPRSLRYTDSLNIPVARFANRTLNWIHNDRFSIFLIPANEFNRGIPIFLTLRQMLRNAKTLAGQIVIMW